MCVCVCMYAWKAIDKNTCTICWLNPPSNINPLERHPPILMDFQISMREKKETLMFEKRASYILQLIENERSHFIFIPYTYVFTCLYVA